MPRRARRFCLRLAAHRQGAPSTIDQHPAHRTLPSQPDGPPRPSEDELLRNHGLIERHVSSQAGLAGLVAAYVEHSQRAGCPAVVAQRRQLDELVDAVA
jgi:hypothetical protein